MAAKALADAARAGDLLALADAASDADADTLNGGGHGRWPPLHVAILYNSAACAEDLVRRGASPVLPAAGGMTPLQLAADAGWPNLIALMIESIYQLSGWAWA